jgi:hypothetical protein
MTFAQSIQLPLPVHPLCLPFPGKIEENPKRTGITAGRIVHFVSSHHEHRAAIITEVIDVDTVNLHVFFKETEKRMLTIPFDETNKPEGTWHWIERV